MLRRLLLLALVASLAGLPSASARLFRAGGFIPASQTIALVPLSGTTFPPSSPSGTVVGTIGTPIMSPTSPAFSGSCCTLSGTDAASFQIVGSNLETNGSICPSPPTTFHINLVATQGGISNSPFAQAETITCSSVVQQWSFVNNGSGTSPGPSGMTPAHTLVSFAPGAVPVGQIAVPFVGGVAIPYGADCAVDGVNPLRSDGCTSWPDGSLKNVPMSMFVPQLAAGGTETVQFKLQAGSYSASSSILPSSIIAISDYNVVLTGVNSSWVPQYYGVWPNGTQIGCSVSAGAVTGCNLRVVPPTIAGQGPTTCATYDVPVGNLIATIDNGSGSPGNTLTITATPHGGGPLFVAQGWGPLPGILTDNTGDIAPGTIITAVGTGTVNGGVGTYTVSGAPQLVASEAMGMQACSGKINNGINNTGGGTPAIFTTTRGANNMPATVTVLSGGSGYSTIGSGTLKFDVNAILNLYGSIDPPTCAAEQGAGVFSSVTFTSSPSPQVVVNTTTSGHIATGQILTDSTGATAVVTGGSSPWHVSGTLTSGAMTAQTPACVWADSSYAGQPLKKSYWVRGPFVDPGNSNAPDAQLIGSAQVDIWSLGGSPYSVRATVRVDREGWQPGQYFKSYTYNADIKNGTAEVRGNAQGAGVFTNITDESPGDWYTVDPALTGPLGASARMDWLGATPNSFSETTNLAINAVNPYLDSGSINLFRGAHAMLPLVSSTIPNPEIIPATTSGGSWDNPVQFQGAYMPFGPMFIDATPSFGSGGDEHFFLGPQGAGLSFWISATAKATDKGLSWLNQMRVGALALSGDFSGFAESDTGHALNLDPNFSNAAFTDPVRLGSAYQNCGAGSPCFTASVPAGAMATGGQFNVHGEQADASHWPSGSLFGAYLVDGEYYQLKQMDLMIPEGEFSQGDNGLRTLNYNGHNYYGITWDTHESRTYAWSQQLINQFVNFAPPQEPDAQYWTWIKNVDNYASYAAFYPWVGSWSFGITGSPTTGSKFNDWTNAGGCAASVPHSIIGSFGAYNVGDVTWMCGYVAGVELLDQLWQGGPGNNTNLDTLVKEATDNFLVKNASANSCPYNAVNYGQVIGNTTTQAPNTGYDNTDIPASPPGSMGQTSAAIQDATTLVSVAGSTTVSLAMTQNSTNPVPFPSGAILNPTQWNTHDEVADSPSPPSPLAVGTWQALCNVTAGASFTGTTSGTTLTVSGVTGTPLAANQYIAGGGITPKTFYITGGSGTTWTLDAAPAAVGPEAMTTLPTGTINPYTGNAGTCSSPAPITIAATKAFNAGWITNQSCLTPPGVGDWAFSFDFDGASAYPAIFWAAMNWRVAVGGATADTTTAIANFTSAGLPTTPPWSTQVNWNACTSLTC